MIYNNQQRHRHKDTPSHVLGNAKKVIFSSFSLAICPDKPSVTETMVFKIDSVFYTAQFMSGRYYDTMILMFGFY